MKAIEEARCKTYKKTPVWLQEYFPNMAAPDFRALRLLRSREVATIECKQQARGTDICLVGYIAEQVRFE
jgi:hypothetical protein